MERDYDYDDRIYGRDLRPAEEIGRRAAERALSRLNPEKPRSGVFPVLFDERVASSLIGHLINAVRGYVITSINRFCRPRFLWSKIPHGQGPADPARLTQKDYPNAQDIL
jgi:hypothetical protein